MKLWRLARADQLALDGAGAAKFGGRYSPPGMPIVSLASEAGLAVLVVLRYLESTEEAFAAPYILGWTESDAEPNRIPDNLTERETAVLVEEWASSKRSLLLAIRSRVLPEADVILMNPRHPGIDTVAPLRGRAFTFASCLHRPPMLDRYR